MMKQDRFLLAVLLAIVALVILALALFFVRRGDQQYSPGDTPEGVIRNYVLALQNGDYERSYAYLAEDQNKPGFDDYQNDLLSLHRELSNITIQLGETDQTGEKALVGLTLIHSGGGPFADVWREANNALLIRDQNGAWKIARMPYPYWGPAWYPAKPPGQ
jgi:hypothetical protein